MSRFLGFLALLSCTAALFLYMETHQTGDVLLITVLTWTLAALHNFLKPEKSEYVRKRKGKAHHRPPGKLQGTDL